jgi:hypothetical protein
MGNSDCRDAREYGEVTTIDVIDLYTMAIHHRQNAEETYTALYEATPSPDEESLAEMSKWRLLAHEAADRASASLALTLQLWRPDVASVEAAEASGFEYKPRGFITCDTLYAVLPDEDRDGGSILELSLTEETVDSNPPERAAENARRRRRP